MHDQVINRAGCVRFKFAAIVCAASGCVAVSVLAQAPPPPPPSEPPNRAAPPKPKDPALPKEPAEQAPPPSERVELPAVDPKWLDRLAKEDREAIDQLRGYAPPAFADDVKWVESEKLDWMRFRGKVVVVQSWTTANTAGRGWPTRVANALEELDAGEFQIVALHTPEKAEGAEEFMLRQKPPEGVLVAIDPSGATCDALGVYKQPVNIIVDRNGLVRYAGLNLNGLKSATAELLKEPFDRKANPPQRPADNSADNSSSGYPAIKGSIRGATDLRGKPAPDLAVESWYTNQSNVGGGVTLITFWRVEEPASLSSHGPINELAQRVGDKATILVISGESRTSFEEEILKRRLDKSEFKYGIALDRNQQMANAMNITAFPYTIVVSKDWIVRWQGHPGALTPAILQQVIDADVAQGSTQGGKAPAKRRGWQQS